MKLNTQKIVWLTAQKTVGNENFEIPSPTLTMSAKS